MSSNTCTICNKIFTDPVITSCGHTFDRHCIKSLFEEKINKTTITCPVDGEKINKTIITAFTMRSLLSMLGHELISVESVYAERNNNDTKQDKQNTQDTQNKKNEPHKVTILLDLNDSMDDQDNELNNDLLMWSKLDLARYTIILIAILLGKENQLSIVSFCGQAKTILDWKFMDFEGIETIEKIIKNLETNYTASPDSGFTSGLTLCKGLGPDNIILLTDSVFANKDPEFVKKFVQNKIDFPGDIDCVKLGYERCFTGMEPLNFITKKGVCWFWYDMESVLTCVPYLIAKIIVGEVGEKFERRDIFIDFIRELDTLMKSCKKHYKEDALELIKTSGFGIEELDKDLAPGGILEGVINAWNVWGQYFLASFLSSHENCISVGYNSSSMNLYITNNMRKFIDARSGLIRNIYAPSHSYNRYRDLYNKHLIRSSWIGFDGETETRILKSSSGYISENKLIKIKDIKKGMFVMDGNGLFREVLCVVVSPETKMVDIGENMFVSSWCPLSNGSEWLYAISHQKLPLTSKFSKAYNFVLDSGHTIQIGNYIAVTLGHEKKGRVVGHPYLGSEKVRNDILKLSGGGSGFLEIKEFEKVPPRSDGHIIGIREWIVFN